MYKYIGIYIHNIYLVKDTRLKKEKYKIELRKKYWQCIYQKWTRIQNKEISNKYIRER